MGRRLAALVLAALCVSLSARAWGYINAGFRSEAEARAHYAKERAKEEAAFLASLQQAIARDPKDPVPHYQRGNFYRLKRDFVQAIAAYDAALSADPSFYRVYHERAFAHVSRGEFRKALADLEEVSRLNPGLAAAYYSRAVIHHRCPDERFRDLAKARDCAIRACGLQIDDKSAHFNRLQFLAAICAELGDFAAAVRWQSKAVELYGRGEGAERLALYERGETVPVHSDYQDWLIMSPAPDPMPIWRQRANR
jgi:tetratricopeptide (TPR) repeat protein